MDGNEPIHVMHSVGDAHISATDEHFYSTSCSLLVGILTHRRCLKADTWLFASCSVQRLATAWTVCSSKLGGGRDFRYNSTRSPKTNQSPVKWCRLSFPPVQRPGSGVKNPPQSRPEVNKGVQLHFWYLSWAFLACVCCKFCIYIYT
jgi:hypothetical protein